MSAVALPALARPAAPVNGRLAGRRVLVTGAGSGIGRAVAELFVAAGARVAGVDLNPGAAGTLALQADVADAASIGRAVEAAAAAFGGLDGLVNVAGIANTQLAEELTPQAWQRVIDVNLTGATLSESRHVGSAFRNCVFTRATLWHSSFTGCSLIGSVFGDARLRPITFDEVDLTLATLGGADLRKVDLSGCRLREASLVQADLREANLAGADLTGARTLGARLDGADLRGARVDADLWTTASLRGAKIDVAQALTYAVAHGLNVAGD